jgi:hypothetical protein
MADIMADIAKLLKLCYNGKISSKNGPLSKTVKMIPGL